MALRREATKPAMDETQAADPARTIEQVREFLFGDASRSIDQRNSQLDAKIDRLAAEMNERFNQVERRMNELQAQTEERHLASIADIGDAITQLGATIRGMGAPGRKR